jgi:SAM-dependent methyltransferase
MMVVNCLRYASYHPAFDPVRPWARCRECGHGFANPRPAPEALRRAYEEDPPPAHLASFPYDRLVLWSDIVHALWERRPGGDFLDVGTAAGALAGVAMDYGYRVVGLNLHPAYEAPVRRLGAEFVRGDLLTAELGGRRFDVIALGDVIEYPPDPVRALARVKALLEPGGLVWLSKPAQLAPAGGEPGAAAGGLPPVAPFRGLRGGDAGGGPRRVGAPLVAFGARLPPPGRGRWGERRVPFRAGAALMAVTFACPCGNPLRAGEQRAGSPVRCPACGRAVLVPAPAPGSLWVRPVIAAGLTLLVMVALGLWLVNLLPSQEAEPFEVAALTAPRVEPRPVAPAPALADPARPDPALKLEPVPPVDKRQPPAVTPALPGPPPVNRPPEPKPAPPTATEPRLGFKEGDRIYQEVAGTRSSNHRALGVAFRTSAQYLLVSSFEVVKADPDGGLVVRQKVEAARLTQADAAAQAPLTALLDKTRGATITITLNARREVVKLEGVPEGVAVAGDHPRPAMAVLQVQSVLDRDGWKELAQLTFFQPQGPARKGQQWARPASHDWGLLGGWAGQVRYANRAGRTGWTATATGWR